MEFLERVPVWLIVFIVGSMVVDVVKKVRRRNKNRDSDLAETDSVDAYNDYDAFGTTDYDSSSHGSYTPRPDEHRYIQRKSASGSSNDMFPKGDSLRKTGKSAIFRKSK